MAVRAPITSNFRDYRRENSFYDRTKLLLQEIKTMPAFPKPKFEFDYDPAVEIKALRDYPKVKPDRKLPEKSAERLLLANWNIANHVWSLEEIGGLLNQIETPLPG